MGEVVAQSELILRRAQWKRNGRRVVLVSGIFDLLHPGHIRLLEQARSLGDVLVIAVQSDAAVKAAQATLRASTDSTAEAPVRPITPAAERAEILAALAAVDCVVEFDGASPRQLIAQLTPDIVVEGQTDSAGGEAVTTTAGTTGTTTTTTRPGPTLVRIPLEPGYSTTRLLERIKYLRQPNA